MPDGERERTVATCESCDSAYAAEIWSNGTIQPIGTRTGCECGSTEFQVIGDTSDTVPQNEEID
ncbi:hypothetical protein EA473_18405 [Natrarchaeobius chitinivorans]|uniref:Uncharacterized protein n=1 Tax=Natrarchaeobius chitinivorans TaxID=1679083 RepID=A0A3N6LT43_NATCH|nr:hypothetical protein [Natrarchaeobius chitinivorans]RQG91777.1 hypothetical protein EA473_18405 [Natrarchaeobius chitinivorans]